MYNFIKGFKLLILTICVCAILFYVILCESINYIYKKLTKKERKLIQLKWLYQFDQKVNKYET